jgi:hypothetical protein
MSRQNEMDGFPSLYLQISLANLVQFSESLLVKKAKEKAWRVPSSLEREMTNPLLSTITEY